MTVDSPTVVRQLQTLERQLAEVDRHREALRAAWTRSDRQRARHATALAERHVRAMAIATAELKASVVSADDLGVARESLSELALRAARLVVFAELGTLRALVHSLPDAARARPLSWGRFWGIDDLMVCVRTELDQITASWRALLGKADSERAAYRAALHAAHGSMRALGTASEFARFLWEGRSRTDWPPLQTACTHMSIALTVRIDVEPDRPLLVYVTRPEDRATEQAS
jgi:hypothetical protein